VLNEMDRYHLAIDAIDRLPVQDERRLAIKRRLRATLATHRRWIEAHGEDLPEVRDWRWTIGRPSPRE